MLTNKEILNPETVIKVINSNMCNSWFSVPSLIKFYLSLKMFNKKNFKNLDRFIFGGEGFPITHLKFMEILKYIQMSMDLQSALVFVQVIMFR